MTSLLFILLSSSYLFISFTFLLSRKMHWVYYALLSVHLFLIYGVIGPMIGQLVTIPLVLVSITIVFFGCKRNILDVIFSLTGYQIAALTNHIATIPLALMGIDAEQIQTKYLVPFLLFVNILTLIFLLAIRKYFLCPKLRFLQDCPLKLQLLFLGQLLMCIVLFTINFIYGETVGYPAEVLSLNGLIITIFTLFTIVLFYCLYLLLQDNYELKLRQKELNMMKDYTGQIEGFYEEFRVFRHDYQNILATLNYYIESDDSTQLKQYFQEKILPSGAILSSDKFVLSKLSMIEIPSIKSIFYSKLLTSLNLKIHVNLEITESITDVNMDELNLSRVLGILLDNAIEASELTEEKQLTIAVVNTNDSVVFSITNSCRPLQVPISYLTTKGYTTKVNHSGLGLYTVQNIIDALDHVSFTMEYNEMFRQVLDIRKCTK